MLPWEMTGTRLELEPSGPEAFTDLQHGGRKQMRAFRDELERGRVQRHPFTS